MKDVLTMLGHAHTIGDWIEAFQQKGPAGLAFEQTGGPPPSSNQPSRRS
jgi:transposase